jgi:universal stress protein A
MSGDLVFDVKEVLAATDFSVPSGKALEAASALARHFHARLHILHVAADDSELKAATTELEGLVAGPIDGVPCVKALTVGRPAREILKYAEREKIDVIVLGTHGRSGLSRVLVGSVAEAVVRDAPCQVLTIGPKAHTHAETPAPPNAAREIPQNRCLVCAKPSPQTICDSCKAHIQGEAIERKRREEQPGRRSF